MFVLASAWFAHSHRLPGELQLTATWPLTIQAEGWQSESEGSSLTWPDFIHMSAYLVISQSYKIIFLKAEFLHDVPHKHQAVKGFVQNMFLLIWLELNSFFSTSKAHWNDSEKPYTHEMNVSLTVCYTSVFLNHFYFKYCQIITFVLKVKKVIQTN